MMKTTLYLPFQLSYEHDGRVVRTRDDLPQRLATRPTRSPARRINTTSATRTDIRTFSSYLPCPRNGFARNQSRKCTELLPKSGVDRRSNTSYSKLSPSHNPHHPPFHPACTFHYHLITRDCFTISRSQFKITLVTKSRGAA